MSDTKRTITRLMEMALVLGTLIGLALMFAPEAWHPFSKSVNQANSDPVVSLAAQDDEQSIVPANSNPHSSDHDETNLVGIERREISALLLTDKDFQPNEVSPAIAVEQLPELSFQEEQTPSCPEEKEEWEFRDLIPDTQNETPMSSSLSAQLQNSENSNEGANTITFEPLVIQGTPSATRPADLATFQSSAKPFDSFEVLPQVIEWKSTCIEQ